MMPQPTWTSRVMGHVTAEATRQTGLESGTPVITGTADAAAEAVAAGLSGPGDMMVMYGSSTFFILRTEGLRSPRGFWASRFLEEGTFVVAGGTSTAGSLTRGPGTTSAASSLRRKGQGEPTRTLPFRGLPLESVPGPHAELLCFRTSLESARR